MAFTPPELPYAKDALAPTVSAETIDYHYGKHHKAYVDNLNKFAAGTKYESMSLEDVIKASYNQASEKKIFNNSAQVWNHTFFWHSLAPKAGGNPTGAIAAAIHHAVGSLSGVDVVDSAATADRALHVVVQEQTVNKRTIGFTASYLTATPCSEEIADKKTDVELKGTLGTYSNAKGPGLAKDLAAMLDQDLQQVRQK